MFLKIRSFAMTLLVALLLALPSLVHAQEATDEGSSTTQNIIIGVAIVIGILYIMRRKKRKSLE